jgi:hypothetical protein
MRVKWAATENITQTSKKNGCKETYKKTTGTAVGLGQVSTT